MCVRVRVCVCVCVCVCVRVCVWRRGVGEGVHARACVAKTTIKNNRKEEEQTPTINSNNQPKSHKPGDKPNLENPHNAQTRYKRKPAATESLNTTTGLTCWTVYSHNWPGRCPRREYSIMQISSSKCTCGRRGRRAPGRRCSVGT